ncbi:hypothetical protein LguiA_028738 [Lonicera macranthoides]
MASFSVSRVGPGKKGGLTTLNLRSAPDFYKLLYTSSLIDVRRRRASVKVVAMGGAAKYKGTQMREKKLTELIEEKVMEAKQVCEGDRISDECKVAWDEVEEISQAKADLRLKLDRDQDPLQSFCEDNPETDECRIYED